MESRERYQQMHKELEKNGKFDEFTGNIDLTKVISPDKNYVYLRKDFKGRFRRAFCSFAARIFVPFVNFIYFGLRIKDKKNVKDLKGKSYISVSNHIAPMDVMMLRQILGFSRNLYCTGAIRSNRDNLKGWFMRGIGLLPFSDNYSAQKNMNIAISELMHSNSAVHVYPERAMWWEYPKPRPFKKGAFTYAVKDGAPILPIYYIPRKAKGWRKAIFGIQANFTAKVMPAVFPNLNLPRREQIDDLYERVMRQYYLAYREEFNDDRENIYDIDSEAMDTLSEETLKALSICEQTARQRNVESAKHLNKS